MYNSSVMQDKTDEELIADIQNGDILAFEILVKRWQNRIFHFSFQIVKDEALAQEVVQDSFFNVYKAIDRVDTKRKFSSFLYKIAKNEAISALRKKHEEVSLENIIIKSDDTTHEDLAKKEEAEVLHRKIDSLNAKYQRILKLYYFQNLSYEEIAQELNLPLNTIRTQLRRAKQALKERMEHENH